MSHLEPGDKVEIFVSLSNGLTIKKTAVYVICDESIDTGMESSTEQKKETKKNTFGIVFTGLAYCLMYWTIVRKSLLRISVFTTWQLVLIAIAICCVLRNIGTSLLVLSGIHFILWVKSNIEATVKEAIKDDERKSLLLVSVYLTLVPVLIVILIWPLPRETLIAIGSLLILLGLYIIFGKKNKNADKQDSIEVTVEAAIKDNKRKSSHVLVLENLRLVLYFTLFRCLSQDELIIETATEILLLVLILQFIP